MPVSVRAGRSARVLALALVLAVAGASAAGMARPSTMAALPALPWWALAFLFGVAEASVVKVRVGQESISVSLSEVPLVMGLFLAAPHDVLTGRLVGSAIVFLLVRRQTVVKAVFNTALVGAGTAGALSVFALVLGGGDPLGVRALFAAVAGACTAGVLDAVCITLVIGWYGAPRLPRQTLREIGTSILVPGMVAVVGTVAVLLLSRGGAALPLAVMGAAALLGYRAFAALSERHTRLERLHQFSDVLAAVTTTAELIPCVVEHSADLLRAGYVEVVLGPLAGDGEGRLAWSLRHGQQARGPIDVTGWVPLDACPGSSGPLRIDRLSEGGQALLAERGVGEAIAVRLRIDEATYAHLIIADRLGEEHGFADADLRLLETVANQSLVALRSTRLVDRLHFEARHDELTGLPNRLSFRELLDEAQSSGFPCAVMLLDVDGFKSVNDTLGHHAGDELLTALGGRLRAAAGQDGIVARLGGDEFAVLTTTCAPEPAAVKLAARLLAVFDEPLTVSGTRLHLGASLGVAVAPRDAQVGSELMHKADLAMYAAKAEAGGVRVFTPEMVDPSATSLRLASDLRDAVARDEIGIAVQPLVDLTSGVVHSVEVLARWCHPELGDIAPEMFFGVAERSGQIAILSSRILDHALRVCRQWLVADRSVRVAVNLAPRWLADDSLPEQVEMALARHGVPADLLCLEITEGSVIADPKRAIDTLSRLRAMGVHLSVDDFGTGYSSLSYLTRLPVDQMKIDRSFVFRLADSSSDRAIVRSIIDLGRNLGLEVVAEGVMDPGARRALQEMGCSLAQGYLFSRPMPPEDLPGYLDRVGSVRRVHPVRPQPDSTLVFSGAFSAQGPAPEADEEVAVLSGLLPSWPS
jgi:diguanylate cyclase (GGDEF)-like protein